VVVSVADLLHFMQKRLAEFQKRGDTARAAKLKQIIREFKAMQEREQQTFSYL